jgi:hypothetical protein
MAPMIAKKRAGWLALIAAIIGLSGCGALILFSMEPDQRAALFLVPADKAVIYFYREGPGDVASAPAVYLDGDELGAPTAAGFWYREVEPGAHSISLAEGGGEPILVQVEAARTYFIGEQVDCPPKSSPFLHRVVEAAGRARVRALVAAKNAQPRESGNAASICELDGAANVSRSL